MKHILAAAAAAVAISASAATAPSFPGGSEALAQYIEKNLVYPATAQNRGVEGVVHLSFLVKADGTIGPIKVLRLVDADLEQEAIRLVKSMPGWEPAVDNGTPVDAPAEIDVVFSLPE